MAKGIEGWFRRKSDGSKPPQEKPMPIRAGYAGGTKIKLDKTPPPITKTPRTPSPIPSTAVSSPEILNPKTVVEQKGSSIKFSTNPLNAPSPAPRDPEGGQFSYFAGVDPSSPEAIILRPDSPTATLSPTPIKKHHTTKRGNPKISQPKQPAHSFTEQEDLSPLATLVPEDFSVPIVERTDVLARINSPVSTERVALGNLISQLTNINRPSTSLAAAPTEPSVKAPEVDTLKSFSNLAEIQQATTLANAGVVLGERNRLEQSRQEYYKQYAIEEAKKGVVTRLQNRILGPGKGSKEIQSKKATYDHDRNNYANALTDSVSDRLSKPNPKREAVWRASYEKKYKDNKTLSYEEFKESKIQETLTRYNGIVRFAEIAKPAIEAKRTARLEAIVTREKNSKAPAAYKAAMEWGKRTVGKQVGNILSLPKKVETGIENFLLVNAASRLSPRQIKFIAKAGARASSLLATTIAFTSAGALTGGLAYGVLGTYASQKLIRGAIGIVSGMTIGAGAGEVYARTGGKKAANKLKSARRGTLNARNNFDDQERAYEQGSDEAINSKRDVIETTTAALVSFGIAFEHAHELAQQKVVQHAAERVTLAMSSNNIAEFPDLNHYEDIGTNPGSVQSLHDYAGVSEHTSAAPMAEHPVVPMQAHPHDVHKEVHHEKHHHSNHHRFAHHPHAAARQEPEESLKSIHASVSDVAETPDPDRSAQIEAIYKGELGGAGITDVERAEMAGGGVTAADYSAPAHSIDSTDVNVDAHNGTSVEVAQAESTHPEITPPNELPDHEIPEQETSDQVQPPANSTGELVDHSGPEDHSANGIAEHPPEISEHHIPGTPASIEHITRLDNWDKVKTYNATNVFFVAPEQGTPAASFRQEMLGVLRQSGISPVKDEEVAHYLERASNTMKELAAKGISSTAVQIGVYPTVDGHLLVKGGDYISRQILANEYLLSVDKNAQVVIENYEGADAPYVIYPMSVEGPRIFDPIILKNASIPVGKSALF